MELLIFLSVWTVLVLIAGAWAAIQLYKREKKHKRTSE